jgi:AcrR family transcriptional regulator
VNQTIAKTKNEFRSRTTRARISAAARLQFCAKGYERTTIRSVARAAHIHPSMVIRYFRTKERLFAAAVTFDLRLPNLRQTPKTALGITIVHHFLERWEGPAGGEGLPSLLRAAATNPKARDRVVQAFERRVAPYLKRLGSRSKSRECAGLIVSQLCGVIYTRYVLKFPSVVRLPRKTILRRVGATIQTYLR